MTRRFNGRPALPPDAKDEILHVLFANMEISGDEIAAILKSTMSPATPTSCRTLPQATGPAPHGQPPGRLR